MAEKSTISEKIAGFKAGVAKRIAERSTQVVSGYKTHDGSVLFDNTLEGKMAAYNTNQKVVEVTFARKHGLIGKMEITRVRDIKHGVVLVRK